MAQKFSFSNFLGINDADDEEFDDSKDNVVSLTTVKDNKNKIVIVEPKSYSEVDLIAEQLLSGNAVIVKTDHLEIENSKRTIDFLNGVIFAISGSIKRLDTNIFICSPSSYEVTR